MLTKPEDPGNFIQRVLRIMSLLVLGMACIGLVQSSQAGGGNEIKLESEDKTLLDAKAINLSATASYQQAHYADAEPLFRRSLVIREKVLGPEHPDVAESLNNLALLLEATARYAEAEPLYRRALAIRETAFGPEHPEVADSLDNLGLLLQDTGRYAEAEPLHRRGLAIREQALGPEHPDVATSLNSLAEWFKATGHYAEAEPLYRRSLAIREKTLDPEHPDVAESIENLADITEHRGFYMGVEPLYRKTLAIREKSLGSKHPKVAISLNNLGIVCKVSGRYTEAEQLYRRSIAIREESLGPEHPHVAASLNNLGTLFEATGRYAEAEQLYLQALAITEHSLGPDDAHVALRLNNLGSVNRLMGRYAEAEKYFRRSIAIREKALGSEHPRVAYSLSYAGNLFKEIGRYVEAEQLHLRALAIREKALGPNHPLVAKSLDELAGALDTMGRHGEAEPLLLRAYRISLTAGDAALAWAVPNSLMKHYADSSAPLAIHYGKQSVNKLQSVRQAIAKDTQATFLKKNASSYQGLADLLVDAGRLTEAQQVLAMLKEQEHFNYIRRDAETDSRVTLASLTRAEMAWQQRFQQVADRLFALGEESRSLKKLQQRTPSEEQRLDALAEDMDVASRVFTQTLDEMKLAFKALPADRQSELEKKDLETSLTGVMGDLGRGAVLIHTVVLDDHLTLMLTHSETRKAYKIPVRRKDLNQAVQGLLNALRDPRVDPRPAAGQLYDWIIRPMAADLKQANAQVLMFYLDGVLRYVPMSVLFDGKQYLAQRYGIALYTAAAREGLKDIPQAEWKVAGMGVSLPHTGFKPLPAVPEELRGIVHDDSHFRGVLPGSIRLDGDFTQDALRRDLTRQPSVVHMASHFHLNPGTEDGSFLLLGDGTHLSLAELRKGRYPFGTVDLVTLSACETASSGGQGSEVEGMAVVVQKKGAKSVLATLWPVDDASTAIFMRDFYHLRQTKHLTKAEALRQAQVAMLGGRLTGEVKGDRGGSSEDADGKPSAPTYTPDPKAPYAHPYYWAPFVLMGNWL